MRKWVGGALALVAVAAIGAHTAQGQQPASFRVKAPDIAGGTTWVNSQPLSLSKLRGRVVALHFWTFG